MGIGELVSRIASSGSEAALIISNWKGNPGDLTLLLPDGSQGFTLRIESAALRREVDEGSRPRISSIAGVFLKPGSATEATQLAERLGSVLHVDVRVSESVPAGGQLGGVAIWLESLPSGKTLWTHHHTHDGREIGPRIRLKQSRRPDTELQ